MFIQKLEDSLHEAAVSAGFNLERGVVGVEATSLSNGDYASAVAFKAGENPKKMAEKIVEKLRSKLPEFVSEVSIAPSGFINFKLSPECLSEVLSEILKKDHKFGENGAYAGKNILVEFTDPNPFKEFHVGHLLPNVIGESLARLFEKAGGRVERMNYQGDVGLHIAKAVFGMLSIKAPPETASLSEKASYLGECYVYGNRAYEEIAESRREIEELNQKIFKRTDEEVNRLYDLGRGWSLEYFEEIYKILGTTFNHYVFESEVAVEAEKLVRANLGKVFEESDGAIVYRGEKEGLHTRVFLNKFGLPTYDAKDLALALRKFALREWDLSLTVTANEQNDYFKVMFSALFKISPEVAKRSRHLGHGLLRFASGKMSSRGGGVVTFEDLLRQVGALVREKMKDSGETMENREKVEEVVSVAAIKFVILRQSPGKDIVFDLLKSVSLEGDSGPYLQYTAVRANSVLSRTSSKEDASLVLEEDPKLLRTLVHFPEVLERAARDLSPQLLVTYLLEVASLFNSFYASNPIIGSKEEGYRLALTRATYIVLRNGLNTLGIKTPERM